MGAQFKSRFVFMLLSTMDESFELEWNYNEAHHGRRAIGWGRWDTIKNLVFRTVKSVKVLVKNPKEFVKSAKIVPSITSLYMPIEEMLEEPLEESNAPAIPETHKCPK